jgi:hypothetical protein
MDKKLTLIFASLENNKRSDIRNKNSSMLRMEIYWIKGKFIPCAELIKHYAMKAYGGVDV